MAPPAKVRPLRKCLRETRERLTITCDTSWSSCHLGHHRDYHFLKIKTGPAELLVDGAQERPVSGGFESTRHISKVLLDDAFLTLRAGCQHRAQLARRGETRIRNSCDLSFGVDIDFDRRDLLVSGGVLTALF